MVEAMACDAHVIGCAQAIRIRVAECGARDRESAAARGRRTFATRHIYDTMQ